MRRDVRRIDVPFADLQVAAVLIYCCQFRPATEKKGCCLKNKQKQVDSFKFCCFSEGDVRVRSVQPSALLQGLQARWLPVSTPSPSHAAGPRRWQRELVWSVLLHFKTNMTTYFLSR